mmetsp:Transcript_46552/g.91589  ORF Transcript_46552/g.91589 Transcript_46552/m.91589 type:complete len:144 (+) Transcript_46552:1183-1614(+)
MLRVQTQISLVGSSTKVVKLKNSSVKEIPLLHEIEQTLNTSSTANSTNRKRKPEPMAVPSKRHKGVQQSNRQPDAPEAVSSNKKPLGNGEEEFYEVEKVLKHRVRSKKREYLVKWEGYTKTTWEPESNLTKSLVAEFWRPRPS